MEKEYACLVVGDINIDFNIKTSFYPPEGGETHAEESVFRLGGSGCTTALILQKMGMKSALAANVGSDPFGDFTLDHVRASGLDTTFITKNTSHPTGFFMILVTGAAQRTMFGNRGANAIPMHLSSIKSGVDQAQHVHFSGYNLLGADQAQAMMETVRYCYENEKTVSLDPGTHTCKEVPERVLDMLPFVDFFFPNKTEAVILSGHEKEDAQIRFLLNRGCRSVILKKGDCGSRYVSSKQDIQVPAYKKDDLKVEDSTGAGDSFNAGFLFGILNLKPISTCLELGNAAGFLMVTTPGGPLEFLEKKDLFQQIESVMKHNPE